MSLIVIPTLLALAAGAVPRGAAPPTRPEGALAPAAIVGRLVLRDGAAAVSPRDARRSLGGSAVTLQLRSGWNVTTARLEDDGFFVVEGEAGEWVIESVGAGSRVEFVDPPLVLRVRGGEVTCAGRVEIAFQGLGAELGNGGGRATATDGCAELAARASAVAGGRTVRTRVAEPMKIPVHRSAWEIPTALRAEWGWRVGNGENAPTETRWAGTVIVGLNRPVGNPGAVGLAASLGQVDVEGAQARQTVAAGLSYGAGHWLELMAGAEAKLSGPGGGSGVFGQLRLGSEAFGLSLRGAILGSDSVFSFGVDLAPLWVLGAFL